MRYQAFSRPFEPKFKQERLQLEQTIKATSFNHVR